MTTFYGWLKEQAYREDPIGDLAKDAIRDGGFPKGRGKTFKDYQGHLFTKGACQEAQRALREAWKEYRLCN